MSRPSKPSLSLAAQPVYLAAQVVNTLSRGLPVGTAYCIGIVLITMFTGQLIHHQGSLARAALPYVVQLRWGWHRVERALERGKFSLDGLFDQAFSGCLESLSITPVRLGNEQRTGHALDSSTIVRLRANTKRCALLGKGYCPSGPAGGEGQHCRRADDRGHGKRGTSRRGASDPLRSDV